MDLWHHPFRHDVCAWDDNEGIDRINTNEYYCHSTATRLNHGYRRRPYVPGGPEEREHRRRRHKTEPNPTGATRQHTLGRAQYRATDGQDWSNSGVAD